jgi:hypothetical protein
MASMMQTMHDPTYRSRLESKMSTMKDDPELAKILEEMETTGPAAMMKCAPLLTHGNACSTAVWKGRLAENMQLS